MLRKFSRISEGYLREPGLKETLSLGPTLLVGTIDFVPCDLGDYWKPNDKAEQDEFESLVTDVAAYIPRVSVICR